MLDWKDILLRIRSSTNKKTVLIPSDLYSLQSLRYIPPTSSYRHDYTRIKSPTILGLLTQTMTMMMMMMTTTTMTTTQCDSIPPTKTSTFIPQQTNRIVTNNHDEVYKSPLSQQQQQLVQQQQHHLEEEEGEDMYKFQQSCRSCLYVGVTTCWGLSLYFWKIAFLELPEKMMKATTTTNTLKDPSVVRHQQFLIVMGGASAMAGTYRLYLG
jgi:hypothetical protein